MVLISKWVISITLVAVMGEYTTAMNATSFDSNPIWGILQLEKKPLSERKGAKYPELKPHQFRRPDNLWVLIKNITQNREILMKKEEISQGLDFEQVCEWKAQTDNECTIYFSALCGPGEVLIRYQCKCISIDANESSCQNLKKPNSITESCYIECQTADIAIIFFVCCVFVLIPTMIAIFLYKRLRKYCFPNEVLENQEMEMQSIYVIPDPTGCEVETEEIIE